MKNAVRLTKKPGKNSGDGFAKFTERSQATDLQLEKGGIAVV
jgi:hypothetical protein